MVFYCLSEAEYETSSWYKHIVSGLLQAKRSKRFTVILTGSVEEIENFTVDADDVLLVIGSNSKWLDYVIDRFGEQFGNRIIVLGNCERRYAKKYSIVTFDVSRDVRALYNYLKFYKKERIAMYGINPHSASDGFRKKGFIDSGASEKDVYINDGDLKQCFENFKAKSGGYDGVICANDYCAISLVRYLTENNIPMPFIVSCGETMLAREFTPSITNLKTNYASFGQVGVQLAKLLNKNSSINSIECCLASDIIPGQTTNCLPVSFENEPRYIINEDKEDSFYSDVEVSEMIKVEKLLNMCDKNDRYLLELVLEGVAYSDIAEKLYMSTNGVKYKLKGMYDICGVNSKSEFLELISKYIAVNPQ